MDVFFVVILPKEFIIEDPQPLDSHEEFTVKDDRPFILVRDTKDGRKKVLDVVKMVKTALSGLAANFVCIASKRGVYQISFPSYGSKSTIIFKRLQELGVGESFGSISVLPITVSASVDAPKKVKGASDGRSLKLRQLLAEIRSQSYLTFDVIVLTVVASILSAFGLALNNAVMVVASMLVSPLMGPLNGLSFGTVIYDWPLTRRSLLSESILLILCIFVGLVIGIPFSFHQESIGWPTFEMFSRGAPISLLYGLCTALPSGIGVAMSILQSNQTSLVGVAISASLLPPAVNCGLLCASLIFGGHEASGQRQLEVFNLALISFALTIVNIACIYIASIVWFKIKEIAPFENKSDVWKCYVEEVVRHRTLKGEKAQKMKEMLKKELFSLGPNLPRYVEESDFQMTDVPKEKERPNFSTQTIHELFSPPELEEVPSKPATSSEDASDEINFGDND